MYPGRIVRARVESAERQGEEKESALALMDNLRTLILSHGDESAACESTARANELRGSLLNRILTPRRRVVDIVLSMV